MKKQLALILILSIFAVISIARAEPTATYDLENVIKGGYSIYCDMLKNSSSASVVSIQTAYSQENSDYVYIYYCVNAQNGYGAMVDDSVLAICDLTSGQYAIYDIGEKCVNPDIVSQANNLYTYILNLNWHKTYPVYNKLGYENSDTTYLAEFYDLWDNKELVDVSTDIFS